MGYCHLLHPLFIYKNRLSFSSFKSYCHNTRSCYNSYCQNYIRSSSACCWISTQSAVFCWICCSVIGWILRIFRCGFNRFYCKYYFNWIPCKFRFSSVVTSKACFAYQFERQINVSQQISIKYCNLSKHNHLFVTPLILRPIFKTCYISAFCRFT